MVQGIDMAIPLMRVGEKAAVDVDARFAYGALGLKNDAEPSKAIPANAKVSIPSFVQNCNLCQ